MTQKTMQELKSELDSAKPTDLLIGGIMASASLYLLWCSASLLIAVVS
jgi:hypothetical protein